MRSRSVICRVMALALAVATLLAISGCDLRLTPATRSDDPGIVVGDYIFATSREEREPMIAPESRVDWDFEQPLLLDDPSLELKGGTQEPADRAAEERDRPFLTSWNDLYVITDDYGDGAAMRWLVGQPESKGDWYIVELQIVRNDDALPGPP